MRVIRGQIYWSKIHKATVRVTMTDPRQEVAEIKHHELPLGEVLFSDLRAATPLRVKTYFGR
jgi:hypothetical protein